MAKYRKEIEAWAMDHYNDSFAHSTIVECWDDQDYAMYDAEPDAISAIKAIERDYIDAKNEQYAAAWVDA